MQEFLASTNFTVIFISLIAIKFLLETYLKIRNLKSIELNKNAIPERFISVITEEEYKKSIDYNVDRIRFQISTALFGAVVLTWFLQEYGLRIDPKFHITGILAWFLVVVLLTIVSGFFVQRNITRTTKSKII